LNSHIADRLVSNGHCVECDAKNSKKWQSKKKEAFLASKKRWRDKNLARLTAYRLEWRQKNLEKDDAALRQWKENNPGAMSTIYAKRRAGRLKAVPAWANMSAIREIYRQARELGMHVDHIIPLKGKLVCGLHVDNNLQLLAPADNMRKRNRFDPEEAEWSAQFEVRSSAAAV